MNSNSLARLLSDIKKVRIGVIGDFCLDAYWHIGDQSPERSIETGLPTRPVRRQRYTLGGAGNVVMNLVDLGVGKVYAFGVAGADPFGEEIMRQLKRSKVEVGGFLTQAEDWETHVYAKPYRAGLEEERLDFGAFNTLEEPAALALTGKLEKALAGLDAVIINEQIQSGIHGSPILRARLRKIIAANGRKIFTTDSRHYSDFYNGTWRKINDREAARLCGFPKGSDDVVLYDEARRAAETLYRRWKKPLFITRGERGCLVRDKTRLSEVPGLLIIHRTDPVGAGDSMVSGLTAALAAGRSAMEAAAMGNFAAGVTVQKLFQTGTASPSEIKAIGSDPDYVYRPELADDPRQQRMAGQTEIEVVTQLPVTAKFTQAIFDHDGTLSTLRQGWEEVMEPMMIKAVLGERFAKADEALYQKVRRRVRDFIDKTTGIQTITQMEGLTAMVREFGCVPRARILGAAGYKKAYLKELMKRVRGRVEKLRRGELNVADFTLKNAVLFLGALHEAGVKLFLASGTDQADVREEAAALGYAELFEGRIYGAVGNSTADPKRAVLERILSDVGARHAKHLFAVGDGPVEIRETHKRGGFTVGIASDEVRRFGLNTAKRTRLIKAGADVIIADYSQLKSILKVLRVN